MKTKIENLFQILRRRLKWLAARRRAAAGFTLIETFVAILILMTALAGALSLASNGFNSSDVAGDQITASYLAQDAVEYVRYVRDSTCINTPDDGCAQWLSKLSACTSGSCYFDSSGDYTIGSQSPQPCTGGTCPQMEFDPDSGLYNYATLPSGIIPNSDIGANNGPSKFTRTVTITTPNDYEADINVVVSWAKPSGATAQVDLEEDMFNWEP